jgi:hypothetical protein
MTGRARPTPSVAAQRRGVRSVRTGRGTIRASRREVGGITLEDETIEGDVTKARRRRTLEASWVIGVVVFVVIRFALAYGALADQARWTVIIFGLLDIGTAVPYAIGIARLVTSLVDKRPQTAARWGAVASASFLAPYLWLAWAGRDGSFPTVVYVVIGLFVACVGVNAVLGVRRRVRDERAALGEVPVSR